MAALLPLLGGRFEAAHLDGYTIGGLLALLPLGRLLAAPLWALLADRYQVGGLVLRAATVTSGLAGVVLARAERVELLALALFSFSALRAPIGAILDAYVLQVLRNAARPASDYGRIRLWGSLGFLFGVLVASHTRELGLSPHVFGDTMLAAAAAVSLVVPYEGRGGPAPVLPALRVLLSQRFLLPLLLTGGLQALTMSVYDTFYSVHIEALGLPSSTVGWSVAVGVIAEVTLMAYGRPLLQKLGPQRALLLATLSGLPRWWLTSSVVEPAALIATQALHGVGFGAFWLAGVERMREAAPPRIAASAQSLWASGTYGAGALCGALLAGSLRHTFGAATIFAGLGVVSTLATLSAVWLLWRDPPPTPDRPG